METLNNQAFYNCVSLREIILPATITTTGTEVFMDCASLETVVMPEVTGSLGASFFSNCTSLKTLVIPTMTGTLANGAFAGAFGGATGSSNPTYTSMNLLTVYTRPGSTVESLFGAKTNGMQNVNIKYLGASPQISAQDGENLVFADTARFVDWELARIYRFAPRQAGLNVWDVTALDALFAAHKAKYGDAFALDTYTNYLTLDADGKVTKAFGRDTNGTFGFTVNGAVPPTSLAATAVTDTDTVHFFFGETQSRYDFTRRGTPIHEITMMPNIDYVLTVSASGSTVANATIYAALDPAGAVEDGTFAPIGATDESGAVTLKFSEVGSYIVYAKLPGRAFTALRATVQPADARFGLMDSVGNEPFETLTKLESGHNAGTFVKVGTGGAEGTEGFDPDHSAYNYYVNTNIASLDFGVRANQEVYEEGMTLAVYVDGEPLTGFDAAPPDTWSAIPVELSDGDGPTSVTFVVTYEESGQTYTRTYTVNVIKSELAQYTWLLAFEPTGRTQTLNRFNYNNAQGGRTLYAYKGDAAATVTVRVSAGNKLYVDNNPQTPSAAGERFGVWLTDKYELEIPVLQDLTEKNPNDLHISTHPVTVETDDGNRTTFNFNLYLDRSMTRFTLLTGWRNTIPRRGNSSSPLYPLPGERP